MNQFENMDKINNNYDSIFNDNSDIKIYNKLKHQESVYENFDEEQLKEYINLIYGTYNRKDIVKQEIKLLKEYYLSFKNEKVGKIIEKIFLEFEDDSIDYEIIAEYIVAAAYLCNCDEGLFIKYNDVDITRVVDILRDVRERRLNR